MRVIGIALGLVVGLVALALAAIMLASELGEEVVTLRTSDSAGVFQETRLWVVDDAGAAWLRAGRPQNAWYQRLRSQPEVELVRDGHTQSLRAIPVETPEARERIHALMAARYGLADRAISLIRDPSTSVAVRLDPIPED